MPDKVNEPAYDRLAAQNEELRARLEEAEETLRAIQSGEVDALVVQGDDGRRVFTLQGADRTYRTLIERMSEGALTLAADETVLFANQRFADMLRAPLEEVIGSSLRQWVAPGSEAQVNRLLAPADKRTARTELYLMAADGHILPAYLSASDLSLEGVPDTLGIVAADLTERKRAEEALRESEQRFATLFDASPIAASLSTDPRGLLVNVNGAFEAAFGYMRDEAIGRTYLELGMDTGASTRALLTAQIQQHDYAHNVEATLRTRSGEERFFRLDVDRITIGGKPYFLQTAQDITDRKRAEQELQLLNQRLERRIAERTARLHTANALLIEEAEERKRAQAQLETASQRIEHLLVSIQDGFFAVDQYWRFTYINERAARTVGHEPRAVLGRTLWEVFPELRGTPQETLYRQAMERREAAAFELQGAETSPSYDVRVYPFAAGISVFWIDITESAHAKAEIQRLNRDLVRRARALEDANKDLESFSYSASHDLRGPLRAIDGLSRMVMEKYARELPEEGQAYLGLLRDNVQQMGLLLEDLLALSRFGRQALSIQEVLPALLVQRVIEELRPELGERQVQFVIGDPQLPPERALPPCQADAALLKQVYVNLLANAVKFTRQCPVAVIEIGALEQDEQQVYYVKDNGVGFDMKYADKLFGVFQRMHSDSEYEGTGVGLAIAQRIIRRHGGRIWAEAQVGKGAAFYFTLSGA